MKLSHIAKMAVASIIAMAMVSCSFFSPSGPQNVKIQINNPEWEIMVDGNVVGEAGIANVALDRSLSHAVIATHGSKRVTTVIDKGLSPCGCLDLLGGCICIIPFIGLASDGAWKLYPDVVNLDVERYSSN